MQKIAVIGAGTMGHTIAGCFARYGYPVSVYESVETARKACLEKIALQFSLFEEEGMINPEESRRALANISVYEELSEAVKEADYVMEAIPEDASLKRALFKELVQYCKKEAVFASNTSSIPFSQLCEGLEEEDRARLMVCHWYNPAHLIPLVELSFFGNMPLETFERVEKLYHSIEKRTATVRKDIPGLLANRIQQAVAREVFSLMEMEAAEAKDIEIALQYGPAFRYATTGQLEVTDFGGLDIWCVVGDNLLPKMDNRTKASDLLRRKTAEGKLGFKSGEGFFKYPEEKKADILKGFYRRLICQLKASREYP